MDRIAMLREEWSKWNKEVRNKYIEFVNTIRKNSEMVKNRKMKYDEFVIETIRLLLVLIPSMQKAIWAARDYIEELENSCGVGYRQ